MIDAGPSLQAAEGLSAARLLAYLVAKGWTARPSRIEGISILSREVGADRPAEFVLPIAPGSDDEQRRVADALRTIGQIEGRSEASVADDVRSFAVESGDVLSGGAGDDVLTGADTFLFTSHSGTDIVSDFASGMVDLIEISLARDNYSEVTIHDTAGHTQTVRSPNLRFQNFSLLQRASPVQPDADVPVAD
jgi:hypothetical protein